MKLKSLILFCCFFLVSTAGYAAACPTCTVNDSGTDSYVERVTSLNEGTVVTTQLPYFDVQAVGGSNKAMVFDSNCYGSACSGGDWDLGVNRGNILIISEDGDSSDPDDNGNGGKLILTSKANVQLFRKVVLVDVEEGATVVAKKNGQVVFSKSVTTSNRGYRTVYIEHRINGVWVLDEADTLEVTFNGSGAIDDVEVCLDNNCSSTATATFTCDSVSVTATKDLSNVVLEFCDGSSRKFDNLNVGQSSTFSYRGKQIASIAVKAGCTTTVIENPAGCSCTKDCLGEWNGDAVVDECGICDGDNSTCSDCLGVPNGSAVVDECGVCDGDNSTCSDCLGVPNGGAVVDQCGVCDGNGLSCVDCLGVPFGQAVVDDCGVCDGDNSTCSDCLDVPNGTAVIDECGVCDGDNSTCTDCLGVPNGNAQVDQCGVCAGDGKSCVDCLGVPFGNFVVDECGICAGDGSTCKEITVCRETGDEAEVITIPQSQVNWVTDTTDLEACNPVTICFEDETLVVPAIVAENYTGATQGECVDEKLECLVCAEVNAFLGQVNVASVINVSDTDLNFTVTYTDMDGNLVDSVTLHVLANMKRDVIVNDLGLEADTYGTVCVQAGENDSGLWRGGVTVYKPRDGVSWSDDLEYVLYYPFTNPRAGEQIVPLNSFKIGASKVAQWIRITDAVANACGSADISPSNGLTGKLYVYQSNAATSLKCVYDVNLNEGGRFDFSGHDCLEDDHVGYAKFVPNDPSVRYTVTASRYLANCFVTENPFDCNDFLTAYVAPTKPAKVGTVYNTVSTVGNVMSVIEMNNPSDSLVGFEVVVYNQAGAVVGELSENIAPNTTRHVVVNHLGLLNGVGYAAVTTGDLVTTTTFVYSKFDGGLITPVEYGFGYPFTKVSSAVQMVEFNSFLSQKTSLELVNVATEDDIVEIVVRDANNVVVSSVNYPLAAGQMVRSELLLPPDTYGSVTVTGKAVLARSFVSRGNEYVVPFVGVTK